MDQCFSVSTRLLKFPGGQYSHCLVATVDVLQLGLQHILGLRWHQHALPLLCDVLARDQGGETPGNVRNIGKQSRVCAAHIENSLKNPNIAQLGELWVVALMEDKSLEEITLMFNQWFHPGASMVTYCILDGTKRETAE